jgi:hypothetical protein
MGGCLRSGVWEPAEAATGVTYRVSGGVSLYSTNYNCVSASLSEDGKFVAFAAEGLGQSPWLFRCEVERNTTLLVSTNVVLRDAIQISRDGRYIAFDNGTNVYRWDGTTTNSALVNQTTGGAEPTNGTARLAGMTPDGNGIAFVSDSPDLTPNGFVRLSNLRSRYGGGRNATCVRDDERTAEHNEPRDKPDFVGWRLAAHRIRQHGV